MSQVLLIRRLWFVLLVSVLETRAKSVADGSKTLSDLTLIDSNGTIIDKNSSGPLIGNISVIASRRVDQDPIESSETIVYNRFENPPENDEGYSHEDPEGPPDHVIPYSTHEEPRNVPTKPRYTVPGQWAKPSKDRDVSSEDVPTKLYARVRRTHTVRRLPRRKAIENAESDEEKENAARLREVVKNTKVNTVYTEEGYEDSAYDHAGHVRDADYQEGYAKKLRERTGVRKKLKDGADEEDSTVPRDYERTDPEEFKDYDEDYRDSATMADYRSLDVEGDKWKKIGHPKSVAVNGMKRLQKDLEREVEKIEKGVEIDKLEKASSDRKLAEPSTKDSYDRRRTKKRRSKQRKPKLSIEPNKEHGDPGETEESSQNAVQMENYSTTRIPGDENMFSTERGTHEATTSMNDIEKTSNDPSELYRYDTDGNPALRTETIDFQRADDSATTVNYGQLFWDYFKAGQNRLATMQSPTWEATTSGPSLLQASTFVNRPYPLHGDQLTTPLPVIEPAVLRPQKLVSVQTLDPEYPIYKQKDDQLTKFKGTSFNELWQPVTDRAQFPETFAPTNDDQVPPTSPERNLDSKEELDKNFGNTFFGPALNYLIHRKPRYKIAIRPKPKKPAETRVSLNRGSTSSPVNEASNEVTENTLFNDNYMKVLMHLKNEDRSLYSRTNNFLPTRLDHPVDLTRMRPPLPGQELAYQEYAPRRSAENEASRTSWNEFRVYEPTSHGHAKQRASPIRPNSITSGQFGRKRSSIPATELLPPAPLSDSDYIGYKEARDYATRAGSVSRPSRNVPGPFRWASSGFRAKRRERRSPTGWESGDGIRGIVKGVGTVANNATSNRGEIERGAKNATTVERNPRRKVTRGTEAGPNGKQPVEKKSRSCANDRGGGSSRGSPDAGSVAAERESSTDSNEYGNPGSGEECTGNDEDINEESAKRRRNAHRDELELKSRSNEQGKSRKKSLDKVSEMIDGVVDQEFDARFKNDEKMEEISGERVRCKRNASRDKSGMRSHLNGNKVRRSHEEFLDEAPKMADDVIDEEIDARFNDEEINEKFSEEINDERVKWKRNAPRDKSGMRSHSNGNKVRKSHEEYLDEAPKMADDVIDEEIDARFNDEEINETFSEEINDEKVKRKRNTPQDESRITSHSNGIKLEKSHEELLDEAPKMTKDVIDEEINARFNDTDEEDADEDDANEEVEAEVPDFDYAEELSEEQTADNVTAEASLDLEKYPFYRNEKLPTPSALKYAIDPRRVPRKTYGKMNFYDSRDAYKQCDEVEPSLEVLPKEEGPVPDRDTKKNLPRLTGLGDKLDCFKAKYFDEDPFDNPLFSEKEVEYPTSALSLDPKQFASRIMMFPKEDDDLVVQQSSKRPENHRRQKKPETSTMRVQKTRPIRYKTYQKVRRVTRPRVYRVKGARVKIVKASRRPQKLVRRPSSSASDISSFYMPYQTQVYEDVMGTIKNMANSYQVEEITTLPSSDETTATDSSGTKTNSTNTTSIEKKEKDGVLINIIERPSNVHVNIEGLMPPKLSNRHRATSNRNRAPQRNRTRMQLVQKSPGLRRVTRRQKIRIYKRNAEKDADYAKHSAELTSMEKSVDETISDERKNENSKEKLDSSKETRASTGKTRIVISRSVSGKGKSKVPKTVSIDSSSTDEDPKKQKSQRVVYTIKDRIRYSKPKSEVRRTGKFVDEPRAEEDRRRNEPRYNYIRRRRPPNSVSITTETSSINLTDEVDWIGPTVATVAETTNRIVELDSREFLKENRETLYVARDTDNEKSNSTENLDDRSKKDSGEHSSNATGYAVHENVDEIQTTTSSVPFNLNAFLDNDPPGYTEFSSEELKKSLLQRKNDSKDSNSNFDSTSSNQSNEKDDDSRTFHRSYFSDEESSEKVETKAKLRPSAESSEESSSKETSSKETSSKETSSKEDKTFFSYPARPLSPAENFEDAKYSELGPRVNKPAFLHPQFSSYEKSRQKSSEEDSKETEETEEAKEYVFPWYKDKEDDNRGTRDRYRGKSIGEYEYPWERRERLAREERRKREGKRKRLSFDDEEDDTFARKYRRNVYPRGRYRYWTRKEEDASEENASDNVESSSEYRPIMKYSSRYSSTNATQPVDEKSSSVEQISRSIKKILDGDSEERSSTEDVSSQEKKSPVSFKSRGISRGMIIPEDVTLASTRRGGRKETSRTSRADTDKTSNARNSLNRNSNPSTRNTLVNSESQLTVVTASPREVTNATREVNSTRQSKRRRKPAKSVVSLVESITKSVADANRSRRRQKPTSPVTVAPSTSTTSAPRIVRKKPRKLVKILKKNVAFKMENKLSNVDNEGEKVETSTLKSRILNRFRVSKENGEGEGRTNEESKKSAKNTTDRESREESFGGEEKLQENTSDQKGNGANQSSESKSVKIEGEFDREDTKAIEEASDFKKILPGRSEDKRFEFKDDRIEALSDFDRSNDTPDGGEDYDDEYKSVSKSDANFTPQNRAVQLSEQGSREIVSTVSWISENYDF